MSNVQAGKEITLEQWLNNPGIRRGILSVYAGEPFNYEDNRASYEIGRQIAILAKASGLRTRGSILRKKPNSEILAIVKTKMPILKRIIYVDLEFKSSQLAVEHF